MDQIRAEKREQVQAIVSQQKQGTENQQQDSEDQPAVEAMMTEAVRELREALQRVIG